MQKLMSFVLLLICCLSVCASAKEGVLLGMPDPAVIQGDDGAFYIYATGVGLPFYRSTNLVDWQQAGRVFDTPVPQWAKKAIPETEGIWAPDIVKLNNTYYVYYAVSSFGSQRSVIGVASNKTLNPVSPEFKWVDQGQVLESIPDKSDFNAIDLAAFQDGDGKACVVWGSFWGGIKAADLNPATGKLITRPEDFRTAAARPDNRYHAIEGAYMIKKGGFYYLFVSWDNCCDGAESTYKVMVGRAEKVSGPFIDHTGKPMVQGGGTLALANNDNWRGPGHNSILTTKDGEWMVHHTYDTFHLDQQRILQIRPVYWTADGWPVVGEPLTAKNPMSTQKAAVKADELIGSWRVSSNYGPEKIIDLLANGKIGGSKEAQWSVQGNELTIKWPENPTGSGFWVEQCIVEPLKTSFIGRDQSGALIRGMKVNQ